MYTIVKFFLTIISRLPWWVLYRVSDFLFFVIYHVVWYRRKVVLKNLSLAFPDKEPEEINDLSIRFYGNFCDQVLETLKLITCDPSEINERFELDSSVYERLYKDGRHVLQATAHQFNWEWGNWILNQHTSFHIRIIYMMLNDKAMERLVNEYRTRFGTEMIPANDLGRLRKLPDAPSMTVFLADQNPSDMKRVYWTDFFGREVPFHRGLEILAKRTNSAVVFDEMIRIKRGHYKSVSKLAFENPKETKENEITEAYARFLEESISSQPENWLWTHKRWKRKRPKTTNS